MTNIERRSDAAIAATRSTLHDLKSQAPGGLRAYVIDLALATEDPLNFWGNYCDVAFVVSNLISIEAEAHKYLYQRYMDEIEAIRDQCLSSPHGVVTYETVNGGVKLGHCGGAKVGHLSACALERAALI